MPFFSKADPEFVATLVRKLKFEMYLYNDEIIREGTIGKKMYFISKVGLEAIITDGQLWSDFSDIIGGYSAKIRSELSSIFFKPN